MAAITKPNMCELLQTQLDTFRAKCNDLQRHHQTDSVCDLATEYANKMFGWTIVEGTYIGPTFFAPDGHRWNRLADGTIVDGTANQYMVDAEPMPRILTIHDVRQHWYLPD